jgi:hypothetical protein
MKQVTKSFVCGNKNASQGIQWCFPGDENCNNYCNFDPSKPMSPCPKTYDTIVWEEKDLWTDVIDLIADYIPNANGSTIFDLLMSKYKIEYKH